jgi:hypothetical protein
MKDKYGDQRCRHCGMRIAVLSLRRDWYHLETMSVFCDDKEKRAWP